MSAFERRFGLACALLLVVVLALWFLVSRERRTDFRAVFLDVGQGDATLLFLGGGAQMLVDCGPDRSVLQGLGRQMPFFDRTIEYLVLTHPDGDHYRGCMDVLASFKIQNVWHSGATGGSDPAWLAWEAALQKEGAVQTVINRPRRDFFDAAIVDALYPDRPLSGVTNNNGSVVLKVTAGEMTLLLTGDAEKETEEHLVRQYGGRLRSHVLHVGHHGSDTSSIPEFLDMVRPEIAVISAGANNRYGHPARRVLRRLERAGAEVRRTDEEGDIRIKFVPS